MKPCRIKRAPAHVTELNPCPADTPQAALERLLAQARGYSPDWPSLARQELQYFLSLVDCALLGLPVAHAHVLYYRYMEGYSERHTATLLTMSMANVRRHLRQACVVIAPILDIVPTADNLMAWR